MELELTRIEEPFVFELKNEAGTKCLIHASESMGGKGKGLRPMELLGGALASCIAIDVLNILKKQRIDTALFKIRITATRKEATPAPFETILLTVETDELVDKVKLNKNVGLVIEKYCSVAASLDTEIVINHKIIGING
ncbi:MAG: OsmC family protein [Crocinitomicaceae bacterium]|nr:OsmC family protein [Crocinitomicaceae bacterium]